MHLKHALIQRHGANRSWALKRKVIKHLSAVLCVTLLVACGGDGDIDPETPDGPDNGDGSTAGSLLSDGTFANGRGNFTTGAATASFNGAADFSIDAVSANPWDVELLHDVSVVPGDYSLCFEAKADENNRDIRVGMDDGPSGYASIIGGDETLSLSTSYRAFKFTWRVNVSDSTSRLQFKLGQSDVDVQLDNIGLYRGGECANATSEPDPNPDTGVREGDASRGEALFFGTAKCVGCHVELNNGSGAFAALNINSLRVTESQANLSDYIYTSMPPVNSEATCDRQCAEDIIAFLYSNVLENATAPPGSGVAHIEGKRLYDSQCAICHSPAGTELTTGVFDETSLREKGIHRAAQLTSYVAKNMPLGAATACDSNCADKISSYIISWHVLPINPGIANDARSGRQDAATQRELCSNPGARAFGNRALKLLTREEYSNTLDDLFGYNQDIAYLLPVDGSKGSFANNNDVLIRNSVEYDSLIQAAEKVAEWAVDRRFSFMGCGNLDSNCANRLINDWAPRIFRRALTRDEVNAYREVATGAKSNGDVGEGLRVAFAAMLSSPQFLYRHEIGDANNGLGNGAYELSSYEIATFLSYSFTRSTPQGDLWQAAKDDQLRDPNRIRREAAKLLSGNASGEIMQGLVHDWLGTGSLANTPKDAAIFGNGYRDVTKAMVTELSLVFEDAMLDENGSFSDLYMPGSTYVNNVLANHYDMGGGGGNFAKVNTGQRGGILLNGAFLSYYGTLDEANPIRRAAYIRRKMLCQYMPPPPPGVNLDRDNKAGELGSFLDHEATTNRMAYHRLTEGPTCLECHAEVLNPLGVGLEDYDGMGRFRSEDNQGNTINAKGRLFSPFYNLQFFGDPERDTTFHAFDGGKELAQMLGQGQASGIAKACLAMQMFNYTTGVLVDSMINSGSESNERLSGEERDGYNCDIQDLVEELDSDSPRGMLESIGALDSIRYRKAQAR